MKHFFSPACTAVHMLLLFLCLAAAGCRPDIEVWISNQTGDNFRINPNGKHLLQGDRQFLTFLSQDILPQTSFTLCRSYGCMVRITIAGIEWPDKAQGESSLKDEIVIEEPEWSTFTAYTITGVTTVSVTEEECYDGIDNDNDGYPDNNDTDCVPAELSYSY